MEIIKAVIEYSNTITVVTVLSLAVIAFVRNWIVSGITHDRVLKERDKYLESATRGMELAQRATNVVMDVKKDI